MTAGYYDDCYEVFSWGSGKYGCLFHDFVKSTKKGWYFKDEGLPRKIDDYDAKFDIKTFRMLKNRSSIIFDDSGRIYSFGFRTDGRLGERERETRVKPQRIEELAPRRVAQVSGAPAEDGDHTLFLTERGEVYGCGSNEEWQVLGMEHTAEIVLKPQLVRLPALMSSISCGDLYSGAVNAAKTKIFSWGFNGEGCLVSLFISLLCCFDILLRGKWRILC